MEERKEKEKVENERFSIKDKFTINDLISKHPTASRILGIIFIAAALLRLLVLFLLTR
jgi:hypothetical protein